MAMVEPDARGDPMSPLRWTCKSLSQLARALVAMGHKIGRSTVSDLLHQQKFSLQANRKTREGASHPDRDAQFTHLNESVRDAFHGEWNYTIHPTETNTEPVKAVIFG
jgi:hypothetical protein